MMSLSQKAPNPDVGAAHRTLAEAESTMPALYQAELEATLLQGDCLTLLDTLPEESVHCCITSPPYYLLRHYEGLLPTIWPQVEYSPLFGMPPLTFPEWESCLGEEPSLEMYIGHLVLICRKIKRVLRQDGTFWLNLGDKSANTGKGGSRKQRELIKQQRGEGSLTTSCFATGTTRPTLTVGWQPGCRCGAGEAGSNPTEARGVVLDPFSGSGTTARVANRFGRNAILIELNQAYHSQIKLRLECIQLQMSD